MKEKKILIISHNYWPTFGGAERMFKSIAEEFAERAYRVQVLTSDAKNSEMYLSSKPLVHKKKKEKINNVFVNRESIDNLVQKIARRLFPFVQKKEGIFNCYGPLLIGPHFSKAFFRYLKEKLFRRKELFKPDHIICGPFPTTTVFWGYLISKVTGAKFYMVPCIHLKEKFHTGALLRFVAKRADKLFVLTDIERKHFVKNGFGEEKIIKIGVGVDWSLLKSKRKKGKLKDYILYMGQESNHKNVLLLMKSMKYLWDKGITNKLFVAGSRTKYSVIVDKYIEELPERYRNRIIRKNDFPETEKVKIIDNCLVFVNPSSYESFGIVFIEAWARKKAVIGADVPAVNNLINNGVDGLLFKDRNLKDLAQKIEEVIINKSLRKKLIQNGYNKLLKYYTWEKIIDVIESNLQLVSQK